MHESLDEIERYIISSVKKTRLEKGIYQEEISMSIGMNITFISQIEAPSTKAKYNVINLNLIAMAMQFSATCFWSESFVPDKNYGDTISSVDPKRKYEKDARPRENQYALNEIILLKPHRSFRKVEFLFTT